MRMDQTLGRDKPFNTGQSLLPRLVIFVVLSIALISLDQRGEHMGRIRAALSVVVYPIQVVAAIPGIMYATISENLLSNTSFHEDYDKLKQERPLLLARLQQLDALEEENKRLRLLLDSAERVTSKAMVSELLKVHPDPYTQTIIIDRGLNKNVYRGQPVIDAHGIVGQVTQVGAVNSTVTLITDPGHAIPVMVMRNGLRTIAVGNSTDNGLALPYLTNSADVREGDALITSGMGGRFPPGYPVGQIRSIKHDPNEPHLLVAATPAAQLNNYKEVLLIWPQLDAATKPGADKP